MGPVDTEACVHCGLCLPSCPTYLVTGDESESPRGRVLLLDQLWAAIAAGGAVDSGAAQAVDDCLDCRACEEVCPGHVPVGHAVEAFRSWAMRSRRTAMPASARLAQRWFGSEAGLRRFQGWVRWADRPVARSLVRVSAHRLTGLAGTAARLAEGLPGPASMGLGRDGVRGGGDGPRVALFYGCVMDTVYHATASHTADLLRLAGYQVVPVASQTCCGALLAHAGDWVAARQWAETNVKAFGGVGVEWVAVTAAGCGAALKEYGQLMAAAEIPLAQAAAKFQASVRDVAELLTPDRLPALPRRGQSVTVHDACHLAHAQGIRQEVRDVLTQAGYPLVEMLDADLCCGSAGLYNFTHPAMASELQRRKVDSIPPAADVVATSNPGCLLQIQAGLRHAGRSTPVAHWVDLVWQAAHEAGAL